MQTITACLTMNSAIAVPRAPIRAEPMCCAPNVSTALTTGSGVFAL